jgi:hypothetical protein
LGGKKSWWPLGIFSFDHDEKDHFDDKFYFNPQILFYFNN